MTLLVRQSKKHTIAGSGPYANLKMYKPWTKKLVNIPARHIEEKSLFITVRSFVEPNRSNQTIEYNEGSTQIIHAIDATMNTNLYGLLPSTILKHWVLFAILTKLQLQGPN